MDIEDKIFLKYFNSKISLDDDNVDDSQKLIIGRRFFNFTYETLKYIRPEYSNNENYEIIYLWLEILYSKAQVPLPKFKQDALKRTLSLLILYYREKEYNY